ncbi:MAG: dihydrofolate reductase, partial [Muribaculaceae bacterium]|nr:dihydrofolate reductase [Muribaculaceae bacterium]
MMSTRLSIIVAVTRNWAIGRGGDLLFHVRDDLRRFKAITMGKPIIMGRKTFESFPNGALPGRRNIVITRQGGYRAPDIETVSSLQDALALVDGVEEAMIIGGGEIYRQALPLTSRLYLTEIDATVSDADTYFPAIEPEE